MGSEGMKGGIGSPQAMRKKTKQEMLAATD